MTHLKKSIAALALSLPLAASAQQAAPAAAPAPLYQIYGTFNVNGQYFEASKPTGAAGTSVAGRYGISVDSSNLGVRGTADTGRFGLGVVYQCETSATVDGSAAIGLCNRNSRLGLTSNFGTIFYGNWDTPYKAAWYGTKADDAFGNTDIYDAAALLSSPGAKVTSTAGSTASNAPAANATFAVRAANSIAYHSPKFSGIQVKAQFTPNENANTAGTQTGNLYSLAVNYDAGPLSVFAAVERHDDWQGLSTIGATGFDNTKNTSDAGFKFGAGYELGTPFGSTTIGAVVEGLAYTYQHTTGLAATAVKQYTRQAMMVNLKHRMGDHEFRARYAYADNGDCKLAGGATCNFDIGKGAQNWAIGYAFYLSKAAQLYAYATKLENERAATYTFATAGPPAKTNYTAGADLFGAGLGMRYAF
jgi:predicted porin